MNRFMLIAMLAAFSFAAHAGNRTSQGRNRAGKTTKSSGRATGSAKTGGGRSAPGRQQNSRGSGVDASKGAGQGAGPSGLQKIPRQSDI